MRTRDIVSGILTLVLWAVVIHDVHGQTVYRDGNSYSFEPIGKPVDLFDNRADPAAIPPSTWAVPEPRQPRVHRTFHAPPTVINLTINNPAPQVFVTPPAYHQGARHARPHR